MSRIQVFAPAKINLTLHVTGQRADGYHLLDTLVTFADVGDDLTLMPAPDTTLTLSGPEAGALTGEGDNLVTQALALAGQGAHAHLDKKLPIASGIGGGSADAAAALRGCAALGAEVTASQALTLGADVPMCLLSQPMRVSGIGETLQPLVLPSLPAVLVNPRTAVSTRAIFSHLTSRQNAPMPDVVPTFTTPKDTAEWLLGQRNDLQPAAIATEPAIVETLTALDATQPLIARMSGSGATCFALYSTLQQAQTAAKTLAKTHPGWWITPTTLGDQRRRASPDL